LTSATTLLGGISLGPFFLFFLPPPHFYRNSCNRRNRRFRVSGWPQRRPFHASLLPIDPRPDPSSGPVRGSTRYSLLEKPETTTLCDPPRPFSHDFFSPGDMFWCSPHLLLSPCWRETPSGLSPGDVLCNCRFRVFRVVFHPIRHLSNSRRCGGKESLWHCFRSCISSFCSRGLKKFLFFFFLLLL